MSCGKLIETCRGAIAAPRDSVRPPDIGWAGKRAKKGRSGTRAPQGLPRAYGCRDGALSSEELESPSSGCRSPGRSVQSPGVRPPGARLTGAVRAPGAPEPRGHLMLSLPVHRPPGGCGGEDPSGPSTRLCEVTGLWGGGSRARGGVGFLGGWPRACETVTTPRASWCRLSVGIVIAPSSWFHLCQILYVTVRETLPIELR